MSVEIVISVRTRRDLRSIDPYLARAREDRSLRDIIPRLHPPQVRSCECINSVSRVNARRRTCYMYLRCVYTTRAY